MRDKLRQLWVRRKIMLICMLLLAGSGVLLGAVRLSRRAPTVSTFEVKRGEFQDSVQFHGEVKALKSITLSAPSDAGDLQIIKLSPEGASVKAGDIVVEFDKTKTEQDLAQYRSVLKSADATIEQAKAQARLAEEEDKTAVLKAGFDVEAAKLEASKQEIVSKIEGEEANVEAAGCRTEIARGRDQTKGRPGAKQSKYPEHGTGQQEGRIRCTARRARPCSDGVARAFRGHRDDPAALDGREHGALPDRGPGMAGRGNCRVTRCLYPAGIRPRG